MSHSDAFASAPAMSPAPFASDPSVLQDPCPCYAELCRHALVVRFRSDAR